MVEAVIAVMVASGVGYAARMLYDNRPIRDKSPDIGEELERHKNRLVQHCEDAFRIEMVAHDRVNEAAKYHETSVRALALADAASRNAARAFDDYQNNYQKKNE